MQVQQEKRVKIFYHVRGGRCKIIHISDSKQSEAQASTTLLPASVARIPRDTRRHQAVQVQETEVEIFGTRSDG